MANTVIGQPWPTTTSDTIFSSANLQVANNQKMPNKKAFPTTLSKPQTKGRLGKKKYLHPYQNWPSMGHGCLSTNHPFLKRLNCMRSKWVNNLLCIQDASGHDIMLDIQAIQLACSHLRCWESFTYQRTYLLFMLWSSIAHSWVTLGVGTTAKEGIRKQ